MATTQTETINAPAGLRVEAAAPNRIGIAYRAYCEAHDCCRERLMIFTASSWEELHLRVFLAYLAHCQDMERFS